ncbi:MAG: cobalt transporter CbiM [Desulfovibrio sp.]|nr:cobalt transporter CbiM [Desulfovibrio sp.]
MHIAEGVLSPVVLGAGYALTAVGTAIGLRRLDTSRLMTVAMLAAVFFVGSLIHVPIGVTSAHLLLNGLLGILLGWAAFPAILAALFLQALLFQFGGIVVLGVNACTMSCGAVMAWGLYSGICRCWPTYAGQRAAGFLGGAAGVAGAALLTALALGFSEEGFIAAAKILFIAHVPVMLAEGCITMFALGFIARVNPEMLHMPTGR